MINKKTARITLGVECEAKEDADTYWFSKQNEMTEEEYDEFIFTVKDLVKHYDNVVIICR